MTAGAHPVRIAPSLLAADLARLADEVARVESGGADWLHLDVMDGHFVPNLTFGAPVVAAIAAVARRPLDAHLMIADPFAHAAAFLDAGVDLLTFHVEVADRGDAGALIGRIKAAGRRAGMSLNPDTDPARLRPWLADLDLVLVMSVFPGFGGQSFMPEVLPKIAALRDAGFAGEVSIDGGVGPETIEACATAGANVFVAGTAVFGAADARARIGLLRKLATAAAGR